MDMEDLLAQEAQLSYIVLGYFLLLGFFLYLVDSILFALSPTSVRIREFLLYEAYKKPIRLLGWTVKRSQFKSLFCFAC